MTLTGTAHRILLDYKPGSELLRPGVDRVVRVSKSGYVNIKTRLRLSDVMSR